MFLFVILQNIKMGMPHFCLSPPGLSIALGTKSTFYRLGIKTAPSLASNDQVARRDVWKDSEGLRNGRKPERVQPCHIAAPAGKFLPREDDEFRASEPCQAAFPLPKPLPSFSLQVR